MLALSGICVDYGISDKRAGYGLEVTAGISRVGIKTQFKRSFKFIGRCAASNSYLTASILQGHLSWNIGAYNNRRHPHPALVRTFFEWWPQAVLRPRTSHKFVRIAGRQQLYAYWNLMNPRVYLHSNFSVMGNDGKITPGRSQREGMWRLEGAGRPAGVVEKLERPSPTL